jgi:hypothetical protein
MKESWRIDEYWEESGWEEAVACLKRNFGIFVNVVKMPCCCEFQAVPVLWIYDCIS